MFSPLAEFLVWNEARNFIVSHAPMGLDPDTICFSVDLVYSGFTFIDPTSNV